MDKLIQLGRYLSRNLSFPKYYLRKHVAELTKLIGPTYLVLDVGSGKLTPYRPFFECENYVGLDYFEPTDVTADATYLPFAANIATVVLATEVFEHLPYPNQTLQGIHRVLQTGGYLLLSVPLMWGIHDYVDYQRWTERGLTQLLNDNGFEIIALKPRGGIFSMIGTMMTQIPAQVFGEMKQQRWWTSAVYMLAWAILTPVPWVAALFDPLDRRCNFTIGYSVLSRKQPRSQ